MAKRELSAWDLIDEVLTEMNDSNYSVWSKDRLEFREILIAELKEYIYTEDIRVVDTDTELDWQD